MDVAIDLDHRRYLSIAVGSVAAQEVLMSRSARAESANAESPSLPAVGSGTNTSFASMKQIDAGLLNVGYAEAGPGDGPAVLLLHGWPYDMLCGLTPKHRPIPSNNGFALALVV